MDWMVRVYASCITEFLTENKLVKKYTDNRAIEEEEEKYHMNSVACTVHVNSIL